MHRNLAILSSLAAVVSALGATGCSSSSSVAPGGDTCDLTAPVSFKTDVLGVFQTGCTLTGACHGQMNNAGEESLYLGENSAVSDTDPAAVYSMLVGVAAKEDPQMPLVTKGDLDTSYLWQKVSVIGAPGVTLPASLASACAAAPEQCTVDCNANTPCGGSMPYLSEPLDSARSCTLQAWITQGAQNN